MRFVDEYNPQGSTLRKQQLRMLEILLYIDNVCKENNIKYWLSSGTLLGAVRHSGFIPWDDDLDIEMLKDDYVKFLKVFPKNDNYVLQTNSTDPKYFHNYAKVRDLHSQINEFNQDMYYKYRGLFVDVFCLERMPRCICKLYGKLFGLIERYGYEYGSRPIIMAGIKFLQKLALLSIPIIRPFAHIISKELHHTYGTGFLKERFLEDIFPLSEIQFEGFVFPAPNDSDKYLRRLYGDYLQSPDPDTIEMHVSSCLFEDNIGYK